ncbi:hypothetical protein [Aquisphaera insulae]|uniref:hypothetical protein n=1 Tax=Aquisphaera insulae TaxID=2712864 RepID=UPI0013E9DDAE|nr:hypothetical protein [Aquisphaera insulae]
MAVKTLNVGDLSPDLVFQTLTKQGLDASQAASFVGEWLVATYGTAERRFDFIVALSETDPAAVATFQRSFVHKDWEDGVSMVQASETPGELGFNARFHLIEADLDALARDTANGLVSLAALRKQVHDALAEVRAELNRLNADVGRLGGGQKAPFGGPSGPIFQGGTLVGKTVFNGKAMQIWQTNQGAMLLPDLVTVDPSLATNPRSQRVGALYQYLMENPSVRQAFPAAVSKTDVVKKFGGERTGDGTLVRDLLGTLPDDGQYANLDALAQDVADREAAALRTTSGAVDAISEALGADAVGGDASKVSVDTLDILAPAARQVLRQAGVDTLAQLAQLSPGRISELAAKDRTGQFTAGDIARASGQARLVVKFR